MLLVVIYNHQFYRNIRDHSMRDQPGYYLKSFFSFLFCRTWLWTARDRDYVNAIDVKSQKAREKRRLSLFIWYLFIFCNTWFRRWRVRKTESAGALSQPVWFFACTGVSRWARVESLECRSSFILCALNGKHRSRRREVACRLQFHCSYDFSYRLIRHLIKIALI